MPSKYNKPIVYPQNENERQALQLQHSLRTMGKQGIKPGFYSEANRDAWLTVLEKAKEILTPTATKEPAMDTTKTNTWTCTCGNVNVTEFCPNCNKTKIQPLSQDELNALDCQNRAAVGNSVYEAVSKDSFTTNNQNRKYFTAIYTFAREPLLEQIEQLAGDVKYRDDIIKNIRQDREDLTQKVADLQAKLLKLKFPKVGDMIWTVPLGAIGHPEYAVRRMVNKIKEEGFVVDGFDLIRKFNHKGKTWWFTKPKAAKK